MEFDMLMRLESAMKVFEARDFFRFFLRVSLLSFSFSYFDPSWVEEILTISSFEFLKVIILYCL